MAVKQLQPPRVPKEGFGSVWEPKLLRAGLGAGVAVGAKLEFDLSLHAEAWTCIVQSW